MEETGGLAAWVRQKPFSILVIAGGLLYIGLALLVLSVPLIVMGALMVPGGEFILVIFLFVALFLIAAVFTLREARWAYVLGSAVSVLFALLYSSVIASTVSNPADDYFWLVMSLLPATFLILLFTILTLRAGKTGVREKRYLATPQSRGGLLTLAVIGFVVGSLIVGGIGRQAILRNIGAPSPGTPQSSRAPAAFEGCRCDAPSVDLSEVRPQVRVAEPMARVRSVYRGDVPYRDGTRGHGFFSIGSKS